MHAAGRLVVEGWSPRDLAQAQRLLTDGLRALPRPVEYLVGPGGFVTLYAPVAAFESGWGSSERLPESFEKLPMVDPYAGDPRREHEDHEAGAQYDDVSERYGLGVRDDHDGWDAYRENPNAGIEAIEAHEKDSTAPTGWEAADDLPSDEDSIPF